jgi:hypothetical protein
MYKLGNTENLTQQPICIWRLIDSASIPFDPANTDYQQFKRDVLAGAELQDDTGNVMTQAEADAFIATLP